MLEPTAAERARTTLLETTFASLATVDTDGRPVVATVPIVDDGEGAPVTVLSNLHTHAERARQDFRAGASIGDRLLIQGDLTAVPGMQQLQIQGRFLQRHPSLRAQVESLDYSWFRLVPKRVRWVDDAGDDQWLRVEDLAGAEPDPLADHDSNIGIEVAERLGDDLLLLAKTLGGRWLASEAELVRIDRYGIVASVTEPDGTRESRIPFPVRIDDADDIHVAVAALVRAGRAAPGAKELSAHPESPDVQVSFVPPKPLAIDPTSLLDAIERDGGGGTHVDGIDDTTHRDADAKVGGGSLFDALEDAGRQTRALGAQQDGDLFVSIEDELREGKSIGRRGEGEEPESVIADDVEPVGEGGELGVGEGVGLTHGDSTGTSVERVAAGGVDQERIDTESGCATQDDAEVRGVVGVLADDDGSGSVENL